MTAIEITLLLVGIVFMVGSFLVTEKLSNSELDKVSELSELEMHKILEKELEHAKQGIDEQIDEAIENSVDKVDRALEKETNEKIMAISEFSDTVMENMNKTHNEIMFLYSMLNDKHASMTQYTEELQVLLSKIEKQKAECETYLAEATGAFQQELQSRFDELVRETEDIQAASQKQQAEEAAEDAGELLEVQETPEEPELLEPVEESNHNARILELHRQGLSDIEIAKELGRGMGEVRLVLGLFREEEAK